MKSNVSQTNQAEALLGEIPPDPISRFVQSYAHLTARDRAKVAAMIDSLLDSDDT